MSRTERILLDGAGRFLQVVKDGRTLDDVGWIEGRVLLSSERLVLAGNEGTRTIPLESVDEFGGRYDVNQSIARVSHYTSVRVGEQVLLVTTAANPEELEENLYSALLDHERVFARHPAVEGGVLQGTEWHPAQLKTEPDLLNVALTNGTLAEIELDDISELTTGEQTLSVGDLDAEERRVLKVEHSKPSGTSVQTYLSGDERQIRFLESLLKEGEARSAIGVDLNVDEKQVLMALHSGVSPFEIPDFVGMEVDRVEEIYERLVELDALNEVRMRREVELTARGRKIAGGAMDDE
ncbi:che operon protein [Salinarchaeum sp. Harcht-Bsk1]|uniref:CheF family chemotaxis protein n=1 Tax=Salinarchaeum sp. Harcht-Bsk1 TaxID=1333523 RepID=UPI00034237B2|nr:CheF family chemotaxis protein [Salinarchaeum sp. Harcht-Bsk1]AGN00421.1 che operon protein [Salinarchaeum sp. Harcht-Bsk1]